MTAVGSGLPYVEAEEARGGFSNGSLIQSSKGISNNLVFDLVFLRWRQRRPRVVLVMGASLSPVKADPMIWSLICSFQQAKWFRVLDTSIIVRVIFCNVFALLFFLSSSQVMTVLLYIWSFPSLSPDLQKCVKQAFNAHNSDLRAIQT